MTRISPFTLTLKMGLFVLICTFIYLGNLLPLQTLPRGWAMPDFVLLLAMTWSVRRPEFTPPALLAVMFLLGDLLLSRPPGLGAALMLMACGHLQRRSNRLNLAGFSAEWSRVALLILGIMLLERIILAITFLPVPSLKLSALQGFASMVSYPLVVGACALFLGIRHNSTQDTLR
jgi:rod shape-determining protein MreD